MNEEADIINTIMLNLRIPEHLQNRVIDYYDEILESMFVNNSDVYNHLSTPVADFMKLYQIRNSVNELKFINSHNMRQIENFVSELKIAFYLPSDIIVKEGHKNDKFFYIHTGLVEVIQEHTDFAFFDYVEVNKFINEIHQEKREQTDCGQNQSPKSLINSNVSERIIIRICSL